MSTVTAATILPLKTAGWESISGTRSARSTKDKMQSNKCGSYTNTRHYLCASFRLTHRHTAVDLIQYTAASGKVAPGLTHALSSWKQNNEGRQRDQQCDSWLIYHDFSKSTMMNSAAHTREVVVYSSTPSENPIRNPATTNVEHNNSKDITDYTSGIYLI